MGYHAGKPTESVVYCLSRFHGSAGYYEARVEHKTRASGEGALHFCFALAFVRRTNANKPDACSAGFSFPLSPRVCASMMQQ